MAKNRRRKNWGFAWTKLFPHVNHPAYYKYSSNNKDEIIYITFTHSAQVIITKENVTVIVNTIPMKKNIVPSERGTKTSYVFPVVYIGKRSALGKEIDNMEIADEDKEDLLNLFKNLPRQVVQQTSNSKKKKVPQPK